MEEQYRVIRIKTNAQNLYGWLALNSTDHPVGHVFMQVELENKVKFMDSWVHEDHRRKGIYKMLWDARWKYVNEKFKGYTVYAWCKNNSLPVYKMNEFDQLEIATHVEKYIQ